MTTIDDHDIDTRSDYDRALDVAIGLRELADFIEANPRLAPRWGVLSITSAPTAKAFSEMVAALGPAKKSADRWDLIAEREFAGGVRLRVDVSKELTCEQVVVGKRVVEREVYPEGIEPTIELVEEDVTEWRCPPSFLALGAVE